MKALVYHGPGQRSWDSVPDPTIIDPTDAIVRIDSSTICGTDLHILKGDVPEVTPGTILGHEAVGTVVEVGGAVTTIAPGDRVLVSCITSCGRCRFCKEGHYGLCTGGGGWIFGHLIDGLQAELARVPFADTSVYKIPEGLSDEQVLFLADILPTAYEVGVLNGRVEPGDTVAVVGAGPVGLAAIMTAKLHTPVRIIAIDLADSRLDEGARVRRGRRHQQRPRGRGCEGDGPDRRPGRGRRDRGRRNTADVRALHRADPTGRTGRERRRARQVRDAPPRAAVDRDVTITTGLVDTRTTPTLLKLIEGGRLDATVFATHHFTLGETEAAYDVFSAAADTHALKVVLEAAPVGSERGATAASRLPVGV